MPLALPPDFTAVHALAVAVLFISWFAYSRILRVIARGSLNAQLAVVRTHWLQAATHRQAKPFDAVLLGHIIHSIAFFGSATLIVLAGIITAFARVKDVYATVAELNFLAPASLELFALQVGLVATILALCFFSYTYALRKLIYVIALVGALPEMPERTADHDAMVRGASTVLSEAVKTFNFGIRGYYYSVAALFMFISPWACIAMSLMMTAVLYYRQLGTPTARAIAGYVKAMDDHDK